MSSLFEYNTIYIQKHIACMIPTTEIMYSNKPSSDYDIISVTPFIANFWPHC